jgi:hypothetical protein
MFCTEGVLSFRSRSRVRLSLPYVLAAYNVLSRTQKGNIGEKGPRPPTHAEKSLLPVIHTVETCDICKPVKPQ